jgi:Phosphoesterase family
LSGHCLNLAWPEIQRVQRDATDLATTQTTPAFGWITPSMLHDMHHGTIAQGDTWLSSQIPALLSSPAWTQQRSLLVITWDEDDNAPGNQVATLVIADGVPAGFQSAVAYNHYSLLRTIELAWGLAPLTANDAGATVMSDFFPGGLRLLHMLACRPRTGQEGGRALGLIVLSLAESLDPRRCSASGTSGSAGNRARGEQNEHSIRVANSRDGYLPVGCRLGDAPGGATEAKAGKPAECRLDVNEERQQQESAPSRRGRRSFRDAAVEQVEFQDAGVVVGNSRVAEENCPQAAAGSI